MRVSLTMLAGAGALMLAFSFPAAATPSFSEHLKSAVNENSTVDQVHYRGRRCWRHHGHLHCRYRRHVYAPYYDGGYYGYGFGPSIGLYFGGGRHFHHGRRHRW